MEVDFELRVSRSREELSKSPNVNKEVLEENRKLQERVRVLERELALEKSNAEKNRKEL